MPALIIGAKRAGVAVALLAAGLVAALPPGVANARNDDSGVTHPNPVLHRYGDILGGDYLFMLWGYTPGDTPVGVAIPDGTNGAGRPNLIVQPQGIGYFGAPPPLPAPPMPIVMPGG